MMTKPVMMIVPTRNGFVLMPFNMNCLVSMEDAKAGDTGILVPRSAAELGEQVTALYETEPKP